MKNAKEYKAKREQAEIYNGWDCLSQNEVKELRADVKDRKAYYEHHALAGANSKATWYIDGNGEKVLRSYYTDVVAIKDGKVRKLWHGYSATTMKHINLFLSENGLDTLSKYDWLMM